MFKIYNKLQPISTILLDDTHQSALLLHYYLLRLTKSITTISSVAFFFFHKHAINTHSYYTAFQITSLPFFAVSQINSLFVFVCVIIFYRREGSKVINKPQYTVIKNFAMLYTNSYLMTFFLVDLTDCHIQVCIVKFVLTLRSLFLLYIFLKMM